MNIVIVGPGALGSLLAALIGRRINARKNDPHKLWLLDKNKERAQSLSKTGITADGIAGSWKTDVRVTADARDIGGADIVLICVKAYNTKDAAGTIAPAVKENTAVITLQNGLGNLESLAETLGNDKVIAGATNLGATLLETGKVRFAGKGDTIIGRADGMVPASIRQLREIFAEAGVSIRISREIKSVIWSKLVINAAINPVAALTRLPNGRLLEFEGSRAVMREAATEAVRIAKRRRIKLTCDDPLAKVEAVCEATSANLSSMLQDILRHRQTEADAINGAIVRLGKESGIPTPANTLLLNLIHAIESSYAHAVK